MEVARDTSKWRSIQPDAGFQGVLDVRCGFYTLAGGGHVHSDETRSRRVMMDVMTQPGAGDDGPTADLEIIPQTSRLLIF